MEKKRKTIVLGVLGVDAHVVGNKIMAHALEKEGFQVVNIGTFSSQADFIRAAIETAADAILVGSLCGHGELECRGFRDHCVEAGLSNIHLVAGGNLVVGKQNWEEVEKRFQDMGFDRAYPPGVSPKKVIEDLKIDLANNQKSETRIKNRKTIFFF
ncbi:MAG: methylaspartate mutase subunit S [Thermodesulfobacteriota bacterium]|nr:methylaspartate mutase subunit S [Thermodesulfobacteriota bacterium]